MNDQLVKKLLKEKYKATNSRDLALLHKFIGMFFAQATNGYLHQHSVAQLAEMIEVLWHFSRVRLPHENLVTIYQPNSQSQNSTPHSIIMINMTDMPFIVDSVRVMLNRSNQFLYAFINAADIVSTRNENGKIIALDDNHEGSGREAFLWMEINQLTDKEEINDLIGQISNSLRDVYLAVTDWQEMRSRMSTAVTNISDLPDTFNAQHNKEAKEFLIWLLDFFTFVGFREYVVNPHDPAYLIFSGESPLGVLRSDHYQASTVETKSLATPFQANSVEQFIIIGKSKHRSTIHRPPYTDVIVIRLHDGLGKFCGEMRFVGLFTSNAYESDPMVIPYLSQKVASIIDKLGMSGKHGYTAKRLSFILRTFPRDELFQADVEALLPIIKGVLALQDTRAIRFFIRRGKFKRFISCLLYIPRANFYNEVCEQISKYLKKTYNAIEVMTTSVASELEHVCVYFVVRVDESAPLQEDDTVIKDHVIDLVRSWHDMFRIELIERYGEEAGVQYFKKLSRNFPSRYREIYNPLEAIDDLKFLAKLKPGKVIQMSIQKNLDTMCLHVRAFQYNQMLSLSDVLPIFENLGLKVKHEKGAAVWNEARTHKFWVSEFICGTTFDLHQVSDDDHLRLISTFSRVFVDDMENDKFNQLTITAGLESEQVRILRAICRYLKQIRFSLSELFIIETLLQYPKLSYKLIQLFILRFSPEIEQQERASKYDRCRQQFLQELDLIHSADEDKVFKQYLAVMEGTVRTNVYQKPKGAVDFLPYVCFKILSENIPEMPSPRPKYEVFTFSPRFEGIHLRADKVARGGLRWSDRREDFRTEVLGLMKAQQVKNALIVPSGAKGGFVLKTNLTGLAYDQLREEGVACYKNFISSLLDITDNIEDGEVIKPDSVVTYDGNDSYLVVAADKGTATFSDIANGIAAKYQFWLQDAFASGGSKGYDHKKMGITAKGAWESVKWHFIELERDIIKTPFTVAGIGGMAGDVFGNGMILSDKIKLVAAFNHKFIFLDPNPDPQKSFEERQRLFKLNGSMWSDYNSKLISKGGGVYSRFDKSIPLSSSMCKVLAIPEQSKIGPVNLIKVILSAPVDLVWNGGIGTYVKATGEGHADVGDLSNDRLRIDASQLRCAMIAEGGNLGLTQLGRIEFELCGGRVNTDFIDNSAGVDCSDHEVNIKILLNDLVAKNKLKSKDRDAFLVDMTHQVSELVLRHNRQQNIALSLAQAVLPEHLYLYERFMDWAVQQNLLNKEIEFLPTAKTLKERAALGRSLTRPELAILLTYGKIILQMRILQLKFYDEAVAAVYLERSFPKLLLKKYGRELPSHALRKQIIATQLSDHFINALGVTFLPEIKDEIEIEVDEVLRAFLFAKTFFCLRRVF